jgi:hypothetical protein
LSSLAAARQKNTTQQARQYSKPKRHDNDTLLQLLSHMLKAPAIDITT